MGEVNIDLSYLNTVAGGDAAFVSEMLGMFLNSAPVDVESIVSHYNNNNLELMSSAAHKIKAPIQMLAEHVLADVVIKIEQIGKHNEGVEQLPELIAQLQNRIALTLVEVQRIKDSM